MSLRSRAYKLHEAAAIALVSEAYIGLTVAIEPSNWGNRRQHGSLHVSHGQTWILRCYQGSSTCVHTPHQHICCILLAVCNLCLRVTNATDLLTNSVTIGDCKMLGQKRSGTGKGACI